LESKFTDTDLVFIIADFGLSYGYKKDVKPLLRLLSKVGLW